MSCRISWTPTAAAAEASTLTSGAGPRLPIRRADLRQFNRNLDVATDRKREVCDEKLSYQGHTKRGHCRPRRHREDATGVVVAVYRGNDAAVGESLEGSTTTDWDEEEIARKISIQTGLAYAEWPCTLCGGEQSENQFYRPAWIFDVYYGSERIADRGGCGADHRGRPRGLAGDHRKSLGLLHRVRHAARIRADVDGSRIVELRTVDAIAAGCFWAQCGGAAIADRHGEADFAG